MEGKEVPDWACGPECLEDARGWGMSKDELRAPRLGALADSEWRLVLQEWFPAGVHGGGEKDQRRGCLPVSM